MTRINTIDPVLLTTPWLLAEYRELPRIINRVADGKPFRVPEGPYRMGMGHVSFFGDKLHWLMVRHAALRKEMTARGFRAELDVYATYKKCEQLYPALCKPNIWFPSHIDHETNLVRLHERWKGTAVEWDEWLAAVVTHHKLPLYKGQALCL